MSFASGGQVSSPQNTSGDGVRAEAFYLGATFVAVLMALVVVRFLVIALIDICFGEDYTCRYLAEFCRKLCPWWHRRTQPATGIELSQAQNSVDTQPQSTLNRFNKTALRVTESEKKQHWLVKQLLPCQILRPLDLEDMQLKGTQSIIRKPDEMSSESDGDVETGAASHDAPPSPRSLTDEESTRSAAAHMACCSICLQELAAGQSVCKSPDCGHWFHAECLRQWVVRRDVTQTASHDGNSSRTLFIGSNHCPNCRTPIVPQQALDDILGILRRHELARER